GDASLFRKQDYREAHDPDYGAMTDIGRSPSRRPAAADHSAPSRSEPRSGDSVSEMKPLFRKNSLDEMTVGRTEKPVQGAKPARQPISPLVGEMPNGPVGRTE